MNLVLVGMMGSGKSSVGHVLAKLLARTFVDSDAEVEARAGRPIADIFATGGEGAFRDLESAAIADIAARDNLVIATGGGAVLRPENREALRAGGTVFWLDAPPEELYRRAAEQGIEKRPLLAGDDPLERLATIAQSRADAYAEAAHYRIQTTGISPTMVAEAILEILKER